MDWSETRSMEMGCWRDVGGTSVLKRGSEWYQFRWFWCSGRLLSEKWVFWWFCSRKGSLWVWPKLRGGAVFTQKSDRLSGWVQKTSFQIWDLTFAPWEQVLWNSNISWGGEWLIFRVSPAFLMPHWPMDMAPLLGRSCTSEQAKHMFFRSYTALVSFV